MSERAWDLSGLASELGVELTDTDTRSRSEAPTGPLKAARPKGQKYRAARGQIRRNNSIYQAGNWDTKHDAVFALVKECARIGLTIRGTQWALEQCEAATDKAAEESTSVEYQLHKVWDHQEVVARREGQAPNTSTLGVGQTEDVPHQPERSPRPSDDDDLPESWSPADEDPDNDVETLHQSAGEPNDEPVLVDVSQREPVVRASVPKPPLHNLPPTFRQYVEGVSQEYQAPPDLAFMTALFSISVATRRAYIGIKYGKWRESLVIWCLDLEESGERKTPRVNAITAPLIKWEKRLKADHAEGMAVKVAAAKKAAKILKDSLDGKSSSYTLPEHPNDWQEADFLHVEGLQEIIDEANKPAPLIFCANTTPEMVASDIADQGGILAIKDTESTYFRNIAGRYANGGAETGGVNQAYEEGTWPVRRRSGSFDVHNAYLPTLIASQPATVAGIFSKNPSEMVRSGYLGRFIIAMPEPIDPDKYNPHQRYVIPKALETWWEKTLMGILEEAEKLRERKAPRKQIKPADEETLLAFEKFDGEVKRLKKNPDYAHLDETLNKVAGNTFRIFCLLSFITGKRDKETMEMAIEWGRYFLESARVAVEYILSNQDFRTAPAPSPREENTYTQKIMDVSATEEFRAKLGETFTRRDFWNAIKKNLPAQYKKRGGADLFYAHYWSDMEDRNVVAVAEETARTTKYRLND
ncbi:DUF3987 domain-containing protein [Streptomyces sp. BH097]|uniref:DUF3987 domain-containing protein n=1 Tax=Streptomyces sp. BH097 TaxID=3410406 RepID=UPI003CEE2284